MSRDSIVKIDSMMSSKRFVHYSLVIPVMTKSGSLPIRVEWMMVSNALLRYIKIASVRSPLSMVV